MCASTQLHESSFHPTTKALQQLPHVLHCTLCCFLTSASAAQPHCLLLGARGTALLKGIPPLPCSCGPALDGDRPWRPLRLQSSRRLFTKALALERCSELTATRDLFCRVNLSSPSSFTPPGLTGSWDCWSRGCWFVKGSLPLKIAFQEARNYSLQSAWFLFPKVTSCVCVCARAPATFLQEITMHKTKHHHKPALRMHANSAMPSVLWLCLL